jgi:hypothetical protein
MKITSKIPVIIHLPPDPDVTGNVVDPN